VPEPTWLARLTAPFCDRAVEAAGGYVIGRNGISFQWRARAVDRTGFKVPVPHGSDAPFTPEAPEGHVPVLEGTNCAFRRSTLARMGGFDPGFRFYLDETDLCVRLAREGAGLRIVPMAQVHHGYAASDRRAADRAPRSLEDIGASLALFLRKHAPEHALAAARADHREAQRRALLRHMVNGALEPRDVAALLETFERGFEAGLARALSRELPPLPAPDRPFLPFPRPAFSGVSRKVAGRLWAGARLRRAAEKAVAQGDIVTVFRFSPTARAHRVRFTAQGWWEQTGGLFGRSDRADPAFRPWSFASRVAREWKRVAGVRQCDASSRFE